MAELGKRTFACAAGAAVVEQANAAVGAEVDLGVLQVHRTFTAGTHVFGQAGQRGVVAEFFAPHLVGLGLGQFLALEVAVQRQDGVTPGQHGEHDADDVAHIPAVTRQVGHQLHKEGKQREEDEAPHKRPPGAFALFHKQPACHQQQGQGQRQAVTKHPQLHLPVGRAQLLAGLGLQRGQLHLRAVLDLPRIQRPLALHVHALLRFVLTRLQHIQRLGAADEFGVLRTLRGGLAGGDPVVEGFAGTGAGLLRHLQLQRGLLQCTVGRLLGALGVADGGAQGLGRSHVHEVVQCVLLLHPRQVAHHTAAQPDQEGRKHNGHQPQAPAKPFFRQTQRLAHPILLVG